MRTERNIITADEGKAIRCVKGKQLRTRITRVVLGPSDDICNWEDCEYGDDIEETPEERKDMMHEP